MEFIILIIALVIVALYLQGQQKDGKTGEKWVSKNLMKLNGKVIDDLTLKVGEDKTSQIDHLFICSKGIFIIETKDYKGVIHGKDNYLHWTQSFDNGHKYEFYNPVKQNAGHTYALIQQLKNMDTTHVPIYSFVIFTRAKIKFDSETAGHFSDFIDYLNSKENMLTEDFVGKLYTKFFKMKENSTITNKQHIQNIHKMQDKIDNNICPRCNFNLVLRQGKYGEFYGCSQYPRCKFIKKN